MLVFWRRTQGVEWSCVRLYERSSWEDLERQDHIPSVVYRYLSISVGTKERGSEVPSSENRIKQNRNTQEISANESLILNDKRSSDPNKFVDSPTLNLTLTSDVISPSQDVRWIFNESSSCWDPGLRTSSSLSRRRSNSTGSLSRRRKGRSMWSGPKPDATNEVVRSWIFWLWYNHTCFNCVQKRWKLVKKQIIVVFLPHLSNDKHVTMFRIVFIAEIWRPWWSAKETSSALSF